MARVVWTDLQYLGEHDRYGEIVVQKGKTKEGLVVYRRRRHRNKTRYMYWSDVGKIISECFDDVLCEIVPNYSISR